MFPAESAAALHAAGRKVDGNQVDPCRAVSLEAAAAAAALRGRLQGPKPHVQGVGPGGRVHQEPRLHERDLQEGVQAMFADACAAVMLALPPRLNNPITI